MRYPTCACGHSELAHFLQPNKRRTYCATGTQAGNCKCKLFEPVPDREVKREL